jgi:hypothetical protein
MVEYYSIVYKYYIFLLHSSVVGHLDCFHSWAVTSGVAMKTNKQVSALYSDLHSFGSMPGSGMTGWYSSSIFRFWGAFILISIVVGLIYISMNKEIASPLFIAICVLGDSHSD